MEWGKGINAVLGGEGERGRLGKKLVPEQSTIIH